MTEHPFWDETTQTEIGWADVWRQFQPFSRAGLRYKRRVRPFLPNEKAQWQAVMEEWQVLLRCLDDTAWRNELVGRLRELPDVESLLHLIERGAALRQVDFFEVKSFLWKGRQLEALLAAKGLSFPWWVHVEWELLLRKLNPPGALVPDFSLVAVGDPVLLALHDDLARLEGAIFAAKKEQSDRLRTRYGRGPSKEGQYVWDKSDAVSFAKVAQDAELTWVQENQFEAVYRVVESAEIIEWREQREQKRVEIEDRELLVLQHLVQAFRPHAEELMGAVQALARLDWALAKADVARQWQGCVSVWYTEAMEAVKAVQSAESVGSVGSFDSVGSVETVRSVQYSQSTESLDSATPPPAWQVIGGWHPIAREAVEHRGGTYTRLDLELQPGVGLITGPNMGGKTVALKTFGLLQALAQHALPVPAERFAFQPVERIGLSGGDEQNMVSGLSSFGGEMQRIATLLQTPGRALLLLDEVARTTNPEEGEALAIGLATYLLQSEHVSMIASHFPRVALVQGVQNFRVAGLRSEVLAELERSGAAGDVLRRLQSAMDYRILKNENRDVPKQAVRLASCFGLPEAVLQTTRAVLQARETGKEGL